jgi:mono/diheme cytochrome c family protein
MFKLSVGIVLLAFSFPPSGFAQQPTVKHVPAKQTSMASGKEMFNEYCASCHGQSGKGDGPAAPALKTPPADLTMLASHNNGQFPEMMVMESLKAGPKVPAHGSAEMPIWGRIFMEMSPAAQPEAEVHQRVYNVTQYVKSLQTK